MTDSKSPLLPHIMVLKLTIPRKYFCSSSSYTVRTLYVCSLCYCNLTGGLEGPTFIRAWQITNPRHLHTQWFYIWPFQGVISAAAHLIMFELSMFVHYVIVIKLSGDLEEPIFIRTRKIANPYYSHTQWPFKGTCSPFKGTCSRFAPVPLMLFVLSVHYAVVFKLVSGALEGPIFIRTWQITNPHTPNYNVFTFDRSKVVFVMQNVLYCSYCQCLFVMFL